MEKRESIFWKPHHATMRAALILALIACAVWGLTDVRSRAIVDPANPNEHRTDLTVYTAAGAAMLAGQNPYDVASPRGWRYLYPPFLALVIAPLSKLPTEWAAVVWFGINVVFLFGCADETRRLLAAVEPQQESSMGERRPVLWNATTIAAFSVVLLPALNTLQRGQVGVAMTYPLMVGLRLIIESDRSVWRGAFGGFVLSIAPMLRIPALLPVGWMAMQAFFSFAPKSLRPAIPRSSATATCLGIMVGLACWTLVLPTLVIGFDANARYFSTWLSRLSSDPNFSDDATFNAHSARNQSLDNAVFLVGRSWSIARKSLTSNVDSGPSKPPPTGAEPHSLPRAAMKSLVVVLVGFAGLLVQRERRKGLCISFGLVCASTLILSPISWAHHFTILLPLLLFAGGWFGDRNLRTSAAWVQWAPVVLMIAHYFVGMTAQIGLLGLGTTLWLVVMCVRMLAAPASAGEKPPQLSTA